MDREAIREYVACNYPFQYHLVVDGGKLVDEWSNVAEHCFLQTVVIEILCGRLYLDALTAYRLAKVAACHDWNKRLEKKPEDFSEKNVASANEMLDMAKVDEKLMRATGPQFLLRVKNYRGQVSLTELIQFFIDDIVDDKVMLFDDRIKEAEKRNPQPGGPELEAQLGRKYWDAEREIGHDVEATVVFYGAFRAPQELVDYLNAELERRFPG